MIRRWLNLWHLGEGVSSRVILKCIRSGRKYVSDIIQHMFPFQSFPKIISLHCPCPQTTFLGHGAHFLGCFVQLRQISNVWIFLGYAIESLARVRHASRFRHLTSGIEFLVGGKIQMTIAKKQVLISTHCISITFLWQLDQQHYMELQMNKRHLLNWVIVTLSWKCDENVIHFFSSHHIFMTFVWQF